MQLLLQPHFELQICILGSLLSCATMQWTIRQSAGNRGTRAWVFLLPEALPSYSEESGPKINHRRRLSRLSSQVNYSRPRKRNRIQFLGVSNTPGIKPQSGRSGSLSCLRCRRATSWLPLKVDQTKHLPFTVSDAFLVQDDQGWLGSRQPVFSWV